MSWQRRSRTREPLPLLPFPFTGCDESFLTSVFALCGMRCTELEEPISSTEQMPTPYAFRNARFTARVSATRISAPYTSGETLDGSASPYPVKPLHLGDLKTVALNTQRELVASEDFRTATV